MVQRDEQGKSQGFGFINYATHEEAQRAVDAMNGKEHLRGGKFMLDGLRRRVNAWMSCVANLRP